MIMKMRVSTRCLSYVSRIRTLEWLKNDDAAALAELERGKFVLFHNNQPLVTKVETNNPTLQVLPSNTIKHILSQGGLKMEPKYSALIDILPNKGSTTVNDSDDDWTALFAYNIRTKDLIRDQTSPVDENLFQRLSKQLEGEFVDLRMALFLLDHASDAVIVAKAQAVLKWANILKFCSYCGAPVKLKASKAFAVCCNAACGKIHYPTISPVAITLVRDATDSHCLLVRQPRHPSGVYTAIAGFSEAGENIESTVARECAEETGIEVSDICYSGLSQHWPLPNSSMMFAFMAKSNVLQKPEVDHSELEDAQWFSREDIQKAYRNTVEDKLLTKYTGEKKFTYIPPKGAVAFDLIEKWLREK